MVKDYDRTLPIIPAYGAELNQVWTNLIDNAVGGDGGDRHADPAHLEAATTRDPRVVVEIADTGPGILKTSPRIFEPFFTTKPVGEGTGLGLDISWRIIVNRHGGDITVHSEPGKTTFVVTLPINGPRPSERLPIEDDPSGE